MLRYHFKLIVRSLLRRKIYALVILLSLTVAFVCSNLLISFLVYENNTDRFHLKGERIFQAFTDDPFGGNGRVAYIPSYFSDYLLSNYAEAEAVCQIGSIDGARVTANGKTADNLNILSVDSSFFRIFDFPLNADRSHALEPGKLVLSREKSISLFGTDDVIGKDVTLHVSDTTLHLVISAVTDPPSDNSHLNFDALIHHSVLPKFWTGGASYVMMGSAASADGLREKINKDPQRPGLLGAGTMTYTLSPLSESYFNTDNRMSYMKTRSPMFMKVGYVVCALILLIAGFNSFNLFTLFWQDRKKEVGIKKTLGVSPTSLLSFAAMETGFYILISYLLSLLLTYLLTPLFSMVFETKLTMEYLMNFKVSLLVGAVLILTAILLILLSLISQWRMKPVSLMSRESERMSFSRGLFTIQFVISITLVICSITVIRQMQYLESAPLGFNRNIIQLNSPDQKEKEKLLVLKQRVVQLPEIAHVAVGSGNPIAGNMIVRYELENKQFYTPYLFEGDADYLSTLDLKLVAGVMPSAGNQGKLVNQALVRQFHLTD
ncbi:MAG: FtsX-like permease family protein, partial [Bacteroidetes bacterium]|nr:FtsX-like permease family protein [Bacteroidota bacterium]